MKRIIFVSVLAATALFGGVMFARTTRDAGGVLYELQRNHPGRVFAPRVSYETEHRRCTRLPESADSIVPRYTCGESGDAPPFVVRLDPAGESLDPDTMQVSALADVIWWDDAAASLDQAIERLSNALRLDGDSVAVLVNLSAAHLVRAERTQNPQDLTAGLNHALQALRIDPRNPDALFNAALASEAFLTEQAVQLWDAYLAVDSTSGWADEARERRQALVDGLAPRAKPTTISTAEEVEGFAARYPQEARELGTVDVLGAWASAMLADSVARAGSLLSLAEGLGRGLRQHGDASLADVVAAIHAARTDKGATRILALAHRAYAEGQRATAEGNNAVALSSYEQVLGLNPLSPTLVDWASEFRLVMQVLNGKTDAAVAAAATVDSLLSLPSSSGPSALVARAYWIRGRELQRSGQFKRAGVSYDAAVQLYERLGLLENLAATRALSGFMAYENGDPLTGYRMVHEALRELRPYRSSGRLHTVLMDLARYASRDQMFLAAAVIQDEDVTIAKRVRNKGVAPEALLARAQLAALLHDSLRVAENLDSAAVKALGIADTAHGTHVRNVLAMMRAGSAADLKAPLASFAANAPWARTALLRRIEFHLAANDTARARVDLDSVTAQIGRMAEGERDFHLRAAIIEQARELFDQLVMLHVRAGRSNDALQALERGRLSFSSGGRANAGPARLAAPPGHVALEYALVGDTLLIWTLGGDSLTFQKQRVPRDSLVLAVERIGRAMEARGRENRAQAELGRLYEWLICPVRQNLGPKETPLVIVADGEIAAVPFAALEDVQRNWRLVDEHPFRMAATLGEASRPQPSADLSRLRALLIANPDFDASEHPTLESLGGAGEEVQSLRGLYSRDEVLKDSGATVDSFRRHAPVANVIHYAGHAVFDDARPERSFLVLADRGPAGRLTADSLRTWNLRGVRLVVLSACRTVRAGQGRSGGFAGLSGALLSAGAGGVVGSLWEVDDALTKRLMEVFHREYRTSGDPAAALRNAQRQMMRDGHPPAAWAGFRYVGR